MLEDLGVVLAGAACDRLAEADADADAERYRAGSSRRIKRHELSIVTGSTSVSGAAASSVSEPRGLNGLSSPWRARVPSGKITAETPFRSHARAELLDRDERLLRVVTVDQRVAAAAEIVRDARDAARQLALRDELREVAEEEVPEERDVEHALMIGDDQVRMCARTDAGRSTVRRSPVIRNAATSAVHIHATA